MNRFLQKVRTHYRRSKAPSLFDADYYLETQPDVRDAGIDPWLHYCRQGFREGRDPHPIFNTSFFCDRYLDGKANRNPLLFYLANPRKHFRTHPLFDAKFYLSQLKTTSFRRSALEHFIRYNVVDQQSPSPFFSSKHYLEANSDVRDRRINPLYHYLRFGKRENRRAHVDVQRLDQQYVRDHDAWRWQHPFPTREIAFATQVRALGNDVPLLLFVGARPDLDRVDAQTTRRLAENMTADTTAQAVFLWTQFGPHTDKFAPLGPSYNLLNCRPDSRPDEYRQAAVLVEQLLTLNRPIGVVLGSPNAAFLCPLLSELGSPILGLANETDETASTENQDQMAEHCHRILFPSRAALTQAIAVNDLRPGQADFVRPGLIWDDDSTEPYTIPFDTLRRKLGVKANVKLFAGHGPPTFAAGIDLFVSTSISYLRDDAVGEPRFVWLCTGDASNEDNLLNWAKREIAAHGLEAQVRFIEYEEGEHQQVLRSIDGYLSTARNAISHQASDMLAMAYGKPMIRFACAGEDHDFQAKQPVRVVPFNDVSHACQQIAELMSDQPLHHGSIEAGRKFVRDRRARDLAHELLCDFAQDSQPAEDQVMDTASILRLRQNAFVSCPGRRRVVFAFPNWQVSGVNTFAENLIRELNRHEFDASIIFTTNNAARQSSDLLPPVPYQFLSDDRLTLRARRERMLGYLRSMSPCVFVPGYDFAVSGIATDLPHDIGVLGALHSDEDDHYLHAYRLGHFWSRIVSVSQTIESKLLDLNPAFKEKSSVIPYGVSAPDLDSDALRAKHQSDQLRILYTGRITQKQKRIHDFVELCQHLVSRGLPFEMTFIGDGDEMSRFRQQMKPFVNSGHVHVLGRCEPTRIQTELRQHHVLALMSEYEGLPLSLLEGMAFGCVPVVTQIRSGISEILNHEENAMLSPIGDADAMANNLVQLHADDELRTRLSIRARATLFERGLTCEQMGQQYCLLIDEMFREIAVSCERTKVPFNSPMVTKMLEAA